jgi:uncharacterized membrane-anchored protein YhcB (DUF1043 family)
MTPFAPDQWVMLVLMFVLGVVVGMFLFAGAKWKRRYREEVARREELEAENRALRVERDELTSLRGAAVKHPVDRDRGPL